MTPTQARLIAERKERLARFTQAGLAHANKTAEGRPTPRQVYAQPPVEHIQRVRREYETTTRTVSSWDIAQRILRVAAREFDLPVSALTGNCKAGPLPLARFVAIGLFVELTQMSYPWIGRQLGGRDHTSILHGKKRIEKLLEEEAFRNRFDQIKAGVGRRA